MTARYTRVDQQAAVAVEPLKHRTCASSGGDSAAAAAAAVAVSSASTSLSAARAAASTSFLASSAAACCTLRRSSICTSGPSFISPRAFFWDDILMTRSILEKKCITTVLTAVKKNKQPAHTPGGQGRLRSWSGPVETDFQGRPRFSSDNRPGQDRDSSLPPGTGQHVPFRHNRVCTSYNSESCASPFQGNLNIRIFICTWLKFGHHF